jgi:hypothetical protein
VKRNLTGQKNQTGNKLFYLLVTALVSNGNAVAKVVEMIILVNKATTI